jgi:hypothetical protein
MLITNLYTRARDLEKLAMRLHKIICQHFDRDIPDPKVSRTHRFDLS